MRYSLPLLALVFVLFIALPAQAQMRDQVQAQTQPAPAQLYDSQAPAFTLNQLFSPEHFRMSHSYEMSFGSFGGSTSSLGMYTNTMMWQFSPQLGARLDVAYAHSLTGNQLGQQGGQMFIRNAEINYSPLENMNIHFSFRQSPYGGYMSPYGYMPRNAAFHPLPPAGN